jgi:hypothetical protein
MKMGYVLTRWLGLSAYKEKKEIFSTKKDLSWKLMLIRDGTFQTLEKINNNAYKVNLPSDYSVNVTFNIFFISLYLM